MIATLLATAACQVIGTGAFTLPDKSCTPGAYTKLTPAQVCKPNVRPHLSSADRRWIVTSYGVPSWSGDDGELDHLVSLDLGGKTNRDNIWTQREVDIDDDGDKDNPKDRLEQYAHDRLCIGRIPRQPRTLRVSTAVRWFLGDWRARWRFYNKRGWPL
jgi:hypothetical protein